MKKEIIRIQLDEKIIGSKPLLLNDTLTSIREKIKEKIKDNYTFLDNDLIEIEKNDENDYLLKDIEVEKIIRLKSIKTNTSEIKIFLKNKNILSMGCSLEQSLNDLREILKNKINGDFSFLDIDDNLVEKEDEQDYNIKDILHEENIIKLINEKNNDDINLDVPIFPPAIPEKKVIDFSKYEIIEKKIDLIIYKYSNLEKKEVHQLIFQYFYDHFENNDYQNAYIILFCGGVKGGKTTAINAVFNIIKGVQLEDNYRFILINEPEKNDNQNISQTKGINLYYVKDYNDKPIILIDSQGYGDYRGEKYDEMIDDAFKYVFSNIIKHINAVCFILNSNLKKLDINTKYILNCITGLFSSEITENLIILSLLQKMM